MQTLVGILCFMSFRSFAVDWEAPESPRLYLKVFSQPDALPGIETSVNASGEGGVYERPVGKCKQQGPGKVSGCSCNQPYTMAGVQNDAGKLLAVVCTEKCSEASSCPEPPKGSVECKPFKFCLINCENDKDCPGKGALCKSTDDPKGHACMYPL